MTWRICQTCSMLILYVVWLLMCFSFWYHISDGNPSTWALRVKLLRDKKEYLLLNLDEKEKDGWENAKVSIGNRPAGYKVRIFLF